MFSKRLKVLRKEKGYTQAELAKSINSSLSKVAMWETEKRDPVKEDLLVLSELFDVSIDYLLGKTNNRNIDTKKEINATTIAAHRLGNIEDLPDEAIDQLNDYIEMLKLKYKK